MYGSHYLEEGFNSWKVILILRLLIILLIINIHNKKINAYHSQPSGFLLMEK